MSNEKGAAAASEKVIDDAIFTQLNAKDEPVLVATQDGNKLTLVIDLGCEALKISSSGKSMLLATSSLKVDSTVHGKDIRVQVNVMAALNSKRVNQYADLIIRGAEAAAAKGASTSKLEDHPVLRQAAAIAAGGAS